MAYRIIFCCLMLSSWLATSSQAEITKSQFDLIIATATDQYADVFAEHQQRLSIVATWESDNVYANAWKMEDAKGETGLIQISGGFARHPDISPTAFALILCHEIGHHIAGPPFIWKFSAEGQSDYFGAADCLRKLFRRGVFEPHKGHIPRVVIKACADAFTIPEERQICARIALAGSTLANYFARKRGFPKPLLSRRDQSVAKSTILVPTNPQCRLDTYFAAALCNTADHSYDPQHRWLCHNSNQKTPANRPNCWFNPHKTKPVFIR
ncbi:MAG: hypothetical protein OQK12_14720 [Motiliproteus sp.]|nr:hypothetical protein [Motiliproteus sp.]MCW9051221.1 hypothetical protein [Motiliproteus sp.]